MSNPIPEELNPQNPTGIIPPAVVGSTLDHSAGLAAASEATRYPRVLAVLENCPILLFADGHILFTAKAAIDGDGSGSSHGDPDFQPRTSWRNRGSSLNSDVDCYIVVPPVILDGVKPVVLGSQVQVFNRLNRKTSAAMVGDVGPSHRVGEISIALANALGIPSSPTTGGETSHVIQYTIYPGKPAVVGAKTYSLQPSA